MRGTERLHSRVLGTLADIDAIAEDWRGLERYCADPLGYFQSFDWCRQWIESFSSGHQPYVVTLWQVTCWWRCGPA